MCKSGINYGNVYIGLFPVYVSSEIGNCDDGWELGVMGGGGDSKSFIVRRRKPIASCVVMKECCFCLSWQILSFVTPQEGTANKYEKCLNMNSASIS